MKIEIIRPKSREEWLKYRSTGIGSSEVGTLMGLNPFETPFQLWLRKTGNAEPKEENFAMRAGHYLEDAVSMFFRDETNAVIQKNSAVDFLVRSVEKPYMQVSPDRFYKLEDGKKRILECKTTQRNIDADDLPKHWFVQLQYQLGVCGLMQGSLAWLTAGRDFGFRTFDFDADLFGYIEERVDEFWNKNVKENIEPDLLNVEDVLKKFEISADKALVADADILDTIAELKQLKEQEKEQSNRIKTLEDIVKVKMGENERLTTEFGDVICTWKSSKASERFDGAKFKAEHPELYKEYIKIGDPTRRFVLK